MNTFVYVSNAEDGDIAVYGLNDDGSLDAKPRVHVAKGVMPMAVSPDKRYLVAVVRGQPPSVAAFGIDRESGALKHVGNAPLAANCPYIHFDRTGRFLLGASYSGNRVIVHRVNGEGTIGEAIQVIPTALNAHSIRTDETNRFVFVPHLGTDQVFQFVFDETSGRLSASTPPVLQMEKGSGPRHLIITPDNRYVFVIHELTATVTALALDPESGLLSELSAVCALPADSKLVPGAPRPSNRDVTNDIWASDIRATPDSRFVYAAERTSSTIATLRFDSASGKLTYLGSTPTEKQPRGFRIDPSGRFMVVSGEQAETVSAYRIDSASGALDLVGRYATGKGGNWVEIVSFA